MCEVKTIDLLKKLFIKNYALIDELSVSFTEGLCVITGETGAGKSILLGGLGLILGNRADLSSLKNKEGKCIVEAEFLITNYNLESLFNTLDLDYERNTIIRREILPSGKSRAFINDTPVTLAALKELGTHLIDIHSQHQTLELTNQEFQFEVIDALAKNSDLIKSYTSNLKEYQSSKQKLSDLQTKQKNASDTEDYNKFLLEELVAANLSEIDETALEEELEQLNNVEEIQQRLSQAHQIISDEQIGIATTLNELKAALKSISGYGKSYSDLQERIHSVSIELDDIYSEIEASQERIEANPERLLVVTKQLDLLNLLYKKHQVQTVPELLEIQDQLAISVADIEDLDTQIASLEQSINERAITLDELAQKIHESRSLAIPKLKKQLEKILTNLGMENARFDIQVSLSDHYYGNGKDTLAFLFSANKGGHFNELKKAASGGELSRIMLAIKAILSKYKQLPSIMFDEIDTGVSGEIAGKMGLLMEYMSEAMQVFVITHLPQIASKGEQHFKVYKEVNNNETFTNIKSLSVAERIQEIAEMLGGKDLSDTALKHARELLST